MFLCLSFGWAHWWTMHERLNRSTCRLGAELCRCKESGIRCGPNPQRKGHFWGLRCGHLPNYHVHLLLLLWST